MALADEAEDQNARILVKRPDQRADLVFEMLFEQSEHPVRMSPRTDEIEAEKTDDVENPASIWEP